MKCVCGYEFETNLVRNNHGVGYHTETIKGDEDFIPIEGCFAISTGIYVGNSKQVYLYACPKCGTVRMEKW